MNTKLNLNLLHSLDVLLTEKNVTQAAEKLFITQSAMSNALKQLREHFKDELLVRGPKGMTLTNKAQTLAPRLHHLITELKTLVTTEPLFTPTTSTRIFNVGMSDMAEFLLLPKILKILRSEAPNVRLEIQPLNHVRKLDVFTDYQLDLACGVLVDEIAHINKEPCFDFTGIVVADRRHPLMQKKLTLADYLLANHVRIKYDTGSVSTNTDNALKEIGKKRNIVVTLPHVMPILFMLKNTDLLATMPAFIPKYLLKKLELSTQPLPFKKKITRLTQTAWVRQSEKDPGLMWLRGVIKRVTQSELL